VSLIGALLSGLTACAQWPGGKVSLKHPDKVLFERGMSALENNRFDVARLTLQTLVNTYPDSEYAGKALQVLEDPRVAKCGESFDSSSECDGRHAAPPPTTAPRSEEFPEPEP
jgi:hypothetical protein